MKPQYVVAAAVLGAILAFGEYKSRKRAPEPEHFQLISRSSPAYFEDLEVYETVTRKRLNVGELMELIDRLPNIKRVSLQVDPPRPFSVDTLAYPQYRNRYTLSKAEWRELQAYCAAQLKAGDGAADTVLKHWRSIAAGTPPFGLQVREDE